MALEPETCLVPLARTEVITHGPWLVGAFTQHGAGHARDGLPNADAYRIGRVDDVLYLAVADGVSSAPLSAYGAQLAVALVAERVVLHAHMRTLRGAQALDSVVSLVRGGMEDKARSLGRPLSDFATTLLVVLLSGHSATVAKIGDGSLMAVETDRTGARLVPLADCPHVGEGVVDLTHPEWRRHLKSRHIPDLEAAGIATLALATDGAAGYLVSPSETPTIAGKSVALSTAYLHDELGRALTTRAPRDLIGYFAQLMFLKSQKDPYDDRTLVVATTRPTQNPSGKQP